MKRYLQSLTPAAAGIMAAAAVGLMTFHAGTAHGLAQEAETAEADNGQAAEQETEGVSGLPAVTSEGIRSLSIVREGEEIFRISYKPAEYKMSFDYWEILNPYDESVTVDTEAMYALYDRIAGIRFSDPETLPEGTDPGLEGTDTYLEVGYVAEDDARTSLEPDHTAVYLIGDEDGEEGRYLALRGQDAVITLPDSFLNSFLEIDPFQYILKIPVLINIEYLSRIDISLDGETGVMSKDGDTYYFGKKKVAKEDFTTLYQALLNVYLESELDGESVEDREEVLRVVFSGTTEETPETELVYRVWDEESCSVAVNGAERFLVKAEAVEELAEQIRGTF